MHHFICTTELPNIGMVFGVTVAVVDEANILKDFGTLGYGLSAGI